nr:hypothetical protein [Tanacetum cinerariifolium]
MKKNMLKMCMINWLTYFQIQKPVEVHLSRMLQGLEVGSIRSIQGIGYGVLEFLGRINLASFMFFGECRHGYAVSSLINMAYW